jgi:hypothetical protein
VCALLLDSKGWFGVMLGRIACCFVEVNACFGFGLSSVCMVCYVMCEWTQRIAWMSCVRLVTVTTVVSIDDEFIVGSRTRRSAQCGSAEAIAPSVSMQCDP